MKKIYVTEIINIKDIKPNPNNPRVIKDDKFKKLVQSIKDFPEMANIREIIVNKDHIILGGNMRFKAMKEAGWTEVPVRVVDWSEEKQREFVIKDNISGGEWDWDLLANNWNEDLLDDWGLDFPKNNNEANDEEIDLKTKKVIEIEFDTDEEMEEIFNELTDRGLKCRLLTL